MRGIAPRRWYESIFRPWLPTVTLLLISAIIGWEGSICIIMAAPVFLACSSIGGLCAKYFVRATRTNFVLAGLLPIIASPIESRLPAQTHIGVVESDIVIEAPRAVIWREIVNVRPIQDDEHKASLFEAMGFPKPISAMVDHEGVGAIRQARFAGNVLFIETITTWHEFQTLAFSIRLTQKIFPRPHLTNTSPWEANILTCCLVNII